MYAIKLCEKWTGLCNQLFALVNGILLAQNRQCSTAVIDGLSPELGSARKIPISHVLDLEKTNKLLQDKPTLIDRAICKNPPPNPRQFFFWYDYVNQQRFDSVLKKLCFKEDYYKRAEEIISTKFSPDEIIHVVHFRIEQDGIKHWSKMNNMPPTRFAQVLHKKYFDNIRKHIPQQGKILALTFAINHPLLQQLQKEGYQIVTVDWAKGRELSALLDLLLGIHCTGTFIGCHNLHKKRGSTFSYVLYRLMNKCQKAIFFDLDAIQQPALKF